MAKKNIKNTLLSIITLVLSSLIFTFLGFFLADLLGKTAVIGLLVLFGVLLFFGYFMGGQLHYTKKIGIVSIVALPMLILTAVFCLFLVAIPVVAMILQYPAAVWLEALDIRSDSLGFAFYIVVFAHYLIVDLAMLVGAYKKRLK